MSAEPIGRLLRISGGPSVIVDAAEYDRCRRHYWRWTAAGSVSTCIGRTHVTLGRFLTGYTGRSRVMLTGDPFDYRLCSLRIGPGGTIRRSGHKFEVYCGGVYCGGWPRREWAMEAAEVAGRVLAELPKGTSVAKRRRAVRLAVGVDVEAK